MAGVILGLGYLATARYHITDDAAGVWILFGSMIILFVASFLAAWSGRSLGSRVQAAAWSAWLGALLIFLVGVPESPRRFAIDELLFDGEGGYPVGTSLADAIWILIGVPVLGLPFGVFGAFVGNWLARRRVGVVRLVDASG